MHVFIQVQSWYNHTHAFHPTCSVNRKQDVPDIWVYEHTRNAPRKRKRQREKRRREQGWQRVGGGYKDRIETGERRAVGVGGQMPR